MFRTDPLRDPGPLFDRIYAYVAYRIGDGPDAEDVTGEVFERALRHREYYDSRKGEPIAWLIGIARRCIGEALRQPDSVPAQEGVTPAPGDLEEDVVLRLTVAAAVQGLPERDREFLALRYGADLSARQIARLFEMQTNAVEVALHRALNQLRKQLRRDEEKPGGADLAPRAPQATSELPSPGSRGV